MNDRMTFCIVLVLFTAQRTSVLAKRAHNIRISPKGDDHAQCLKHESKTACRTFDFVLDQIEKTKELQNSTQIIVEGGPYFLNKSYLFENLKDFAIRGASSVLEAKQAVSDESHEITIKCGDISACGLSFIRCEDITLSNMVFQNCGAWQNSTSINNPKFLSALFLAYCKNLLILRCRISGSPGAGITLYDVGGKVHLESCTFLENRASHSWNISYGNGTVRAGGGLLVELTNCGALHPFKCSGAETDNYNGGGVYKIRDSNFVRNNFTMDVNFHQTFNQNPSGKNFDSFGRGGGISFFIKGNATRNRFFIENCTFRNNTADWGAGYALYFQDNSNGNSLFVEGSRFQGNTARYGGGAVKCASTVFGTFHELIKRQPNHYTHANCSFHLNAAREGWGGAFSAFGSTSYLGPRGWQNQLTPAFINCSWSENSATAGAAIGVLTQPVELWRQTAGRLERGFSFAIRLSDNWFTMNTVMPTQKHVTVYGMGTIYSVSVPIIMTGNVNFTENSHTALVLDSASAEICGHVLFYKNTGIDGGAVGMYGTSSFVLNEGARLTFKENAASRSAGAIYVRTAGPDMTAFYQTIFQRHYCFFRYYNETLYPDQWDVSVVFEGNTASFEVGKTIFANTLQFCRLGQEGLINNAIKNWTRFVFRDKNESLSNDTLEVATEAVQIFVQEKNWNKVSPNEEFSPSIQLLDERNNSVYGLIKVSVEQHRDKHSVKIADNVSPYFFVKDRIKSIWLNGKPQSTYNVSITSVDAQAVNLTVANLTLQDCPPGFVQQGDTCVCLTVKRKTRGISRCGKNGKSLYLRKGYWAGHTGCPFSVLKCPDGYCQCDKAIPNGLTEECECFFNSSNQCVSGRTGILCGKCQPGLSVVIGSYRCRICNKNDIFLLIPYFALLTAIVFLVLYFRLDFFSGYLNCWLYTYQMAYLLLSQDFLIEDPFMYFVAKLANSRFVFGSWCLWSGMNDLQKVSFGYVSPLYQVCSLFLFAKLSSRFAVLQGNYFRPFCTILVLSYSAIVDTTFKQLHPVSICSHWRVYIQADTHFFQGDHIKHAAVAIIALFLVVLPLPLLLTHSSFFTSRSRYFARVSMPLFDVLQSCYRAERSWYAAFYLVCRLLAILLHTYIPDTIARYKILQIFCLVVLAIFLVLKPYKSDTLNHIDTFYLVFLLFLSVLTEVVNSCPFYVSSFYEFCRYLIHILLYIPLIYFIVILYFRTKTRKQDIQLERKTRSLVQASTQTSSHYEPL